MKNTNFVVSMLVKYSVIVVLISLVGCASTPDEKPTFVKRIPFNVSEYRNLPDIRSGNNTVTGQAFLRTVGGEIRTAAGYTILLVPFTSYSQQYWDVMVKGKKRLEPIPEEARKIIFSESVSSEKICDGDGRFKFENVPDGEYYLSTIIVWGGESIAAQGGMVLRKFSVSGGESVDLIINGRDDGDFGYVPYALSKY